MLTPEKLRRSGTWMLVLLVLLAFGLRCLALDRRPLHFDEGNNVYFARNALNLLALSIINAEADPPLHRALLGIWMAPAGPDPFAIRLFSVFCGVLAVALMGPLARALRLRGAAPLVAAALLALAPFHIDYSQEAKGYALVSAAALASWIAWLRLSHRRMRAIYVIASLLAIGTHFFVAPLFAMQWLHWWFAARRAGTFLRRVALQACVAAPVMLWIVFAWQGIVAGGAKAAAEVHAINPFAVIASILGEFVVGRHQAEGTILAAGAVLAALLALGCVAAWHTTRSAFWFGASLVLSLAFALALAPRLSIFYPRFLLWALPNAIVLVASLVARQRGTVLAGGALVLPLLVVLPSFYTQPLDVANDFRPLVARLAPLVRPGDLAYGTYIWMDGMFASYAPRTEGHITWARDFYKQDGSDIDAVMAQAGQRARVWHMNFLRSPDAPTTLSAQWLKRNGAEALRDREGNLTALLFDTQPRSPAQSDMLLFNQRVVLIQAPVPRSARPGDIVRADLSWQALVPLDDLAIFMHLVGPDGALVAQQDGDAVNGLRPAFAWSPFGAPIEESRAVVLPANALPGRYELRVGLYTRATGSRLIAGNGLDYFRLGEIEVR